MKKKVLFALIALFSCLTTWATDVTTQDGLKAVFAAGGLATLQGDIDVDEAINVAEDKTVTLDLNGCTIRYIGAHIDTGVIGVPRGATLVVEDNSTAKTGTIDGSYGNTAMVGIAVTKKNDNAEKVASLTVNGGTIIGESYGISGNGKRNGSSVIINGGVIKNSSTTEGTGIYNPQAGMLVINGGEIEGWDAAVEIRSGACEFTQTAGTLTAKNPTYSCNPNSNGTTTKGAALAIAQHTTNQAINVVISNGTFNGTVALSIANPQLNQGTGDVAVAVTGGEFNGNVIISDDRIDPVEILTGGATFDGSLEVSVEETSGVYSPAGTAQPILTVEYGGLPYHKRANADDNSQSYTMTIFDEEGNEVDGPIVNVGEYTILVNAEGALAAVSYTVVPRVATGLTLPNMPTFIYNGEAQYPDFEGNDAEPVTVYDDDYLMTFGEDFTVVFPGSDYTNVKPTTAGVPENKPFTIVGIGNYEGTEVAKSYKINPFKLTADNFGVAPTAYTWNGTTEQIPTVSASVMLGEEQGDEYVLDGDDFDVELATGSNGIAIGEQVLDVTGKGNFVTGAWSEGNDPTFTVGPVQKTYNITPRSIPEFEFANNIEYEFDGTAKYLADANKPVIVDAELNYTLAEGTDYDIVYDDAADYINVGQKSFTIQGLGHYATEEPIGDENFVYSVTKRDLNTLPAEAFTVYNVVYDGNQHPVNITGENAQTDYKVSFKVNDIEYLSDADYDLVFGDDGDESTEDYVDVNEWTVRFVAKGSSQNFMGETARTFNINGSELVINAAQIEKFYGEDDPLKPNFTVDGNSPRQLARESDKEEVKKYLTFNRYNDEGNGVGSHQYYIALVPDNQREGLNYDITIQHNTSLLIVKKAPITITINPTSKTYGETDPAFTATPVEPDKFKYNDDASAITITREKAGTEEGENVGSYPFHATSANYDVTIAESTREFTINADNGATVKAPDVTYTGKYQTPVTVWDGETQLTLNTDYTISYDANKNAGNASYEITFKGNYSGTKNGTFQIKKKSIHVKAKAINATTGYQLSQDDLSFEYYDEYAEGETKADVEKSPYFTAPTGTLKATSDPKIFTIELTGGQSQNYTFVYDNTGIVSIGRAVLEITATGTKVYGKEDPEFTVTATGWAKGESEAAKEEFLKSYGHDYFFTMERTEGENVGSYTINFDGPTAVGSEGSGYKIQYNPGQFTITPAPLHIYAVSAEKYFGEDDPSPWPIEVGQDELQNEDELEDIQTYVWHWYAWSGTANTYSVTRQSGEGVGTYNVLSITPDNNYHNNETALNNYEVTWAVKDGAKLTIKPIEIALKVSDDEITYGEEYEPALEVTSPTTLRNSQKTAIINALKGNKPDSEEPLVTYSLADGTDIPETPIAAGTYSIKATVPESILNYAITGCANGTLTVGQYELAVKANDQGIDYGAQINPYDVTINGVGYSKGTDVLPTGDKLEDILGLVTECTHVGANKNAFAYDEETERSKSANYDISDLENGWLHITPLPYIPLEETDLAELTSNKLSQVLKDHDGVTRDVYLPQRGMFMEQWYAFVLPFDFKASEFAKVVQYEVINMLDESNQADSYVFQIAAGVIPANTPFLVQIADENLKGADMKAICFKDKLIQYSEELTVANKNGEGDYKFTGTYDSFTGFTAANGFDPENVQYSVYRNYDLTKPENADKKPQFEKAGATTKVNETEAFLELPVSVQLADVRIFVEDANGNTTAINGVAEDAIEVAADGWYTVTGVKLEAQPTTPGTYIFNGKKVYIK